MKPHAGGLLGVRPEAREHSVRLVACHMHDAIALKRAGDALDHKLQCIFKASFTIEQIYSFFLGGRVQGYIDVVTVVSKQLLAYKRAVLATTTWLPSLL